MELGPLTVLAGANSVGKSTAIDALMSLVQSDQQASGNVLRLSGEWVDLGDFKQALNYSRSGDERRFHIGLSSVDGEGRRVDALWAFVEDSADAGATALVESIDLRETAADSSAAWRAERPDGASAYHWSALDPESGAMLEDRFACRLRSPLEIQGTDRDEPHRLFPFRVDEVHYLGAYRDRPRRLFEPRRSSLGPSLGPLGENTAELLARARLVPTDIAPGDATAPFLSTVNRRWTHIFGVELTLTAQMQGRLGYTLTVDTPAAEDVELGQVGLGLSQLLPVVTLCCLAQPRALVVVESPEIHLHPAAQHRLADLFVALVRKGRQVIVETHSDHLVNALRLAVKRGRGAGGLDPQDLAIQFFSAPDGATAVRRVAVDKDGRLPEWPAGFFDQSTTDLLELLR